MEQMVLGKTNLTVGRTGFGGIPIQRIPYEESTKILQYAYENGVTLYDTANAYSTSEERIGLALSHVRDKIVICTKSAPIAPESIIKNIDNSLKMLKTDYIDVYQVHCASFVPKPDGEDGIYDTLQKVKEQGKIRHIGISAHKISVAQEAVESGLYDVLQYPFSYLSSKREIDLVNLSKKSKVGFLAMKGMCGGLLTNAKAAFSFLRQYANVVPIWGVQKMDEIKEFILYENNPPVMDELMINEIEANKKELGSSFCRACGYCLPCPAEIPINMAARIIFLMGRMPGGMKGGRFFQPEWKEIMKRIDNCVGCGHCKSNCPYELDVPALLKSQYDEYLRLVKAVR